MYRSIKNAALILTLTTGVANADVIFDTGTPEPGFIGYYGFDVYVEQSVAIAFTPDQDYSLDQVGVWMMSNDFSNAGAPYTLSLRTDANDSMTNPGDTIIESWDVQTAAIGWNPILETVDSILNPLLSAGTTYWIVAESNSPAFVDAVWVASQQSEPVWHSIQNSANPNGEWIPGYTQGAPGLLIQGSAVPAPSVLAMIGMGGLVGTRRRRAN